LKTPGVLELSNPDPYTLPAPRQPRGSPGSSQRQRARPPKGGQIPLDLQIPTGF